MPLYSIPYTFIPLYTNSNYIKRILAVLCLLAAIHFFSGCEKEIHIDVPESGSQLVVEGRIESDGITKTPPFVLLSKSTGYFEPTSLSALEALFVHNAQVTVTVDNIDYPLEELCLANIDSAFIPLVADFLGISQDDLGLFNYCIYTVPIADLISGNYLSGVPGKTYSLSILSEGKTYTAITKISELVKLDSVWYKAQIQDTLGFTWARLTDPVAIGNAYRWFSKRINLNPNGEPKDANFIAPFGSAFDDKFINGKSFDFAYDRGHPPGGETEEFADEVPHYYKPQDTIVVKFCTIDMDVYRFLRIYEVDVNNAGSPFASPSTIPTNIVGGGLGLWAGYGVTYDTIYGTK